MGRRVGGAGRRKDLDATMAPGPGCDLLKADRELMGGGPCDAWQAGGSGISTVSYVLVGPKMMAGRPTA